MTPRRELVNLLTACKHAPEDDHARLIVADWLEEHGDEDDRDRADWVRFDATLGEARGRPDFHWARHREWERISAGWTKFSRTLRRSSPCLSVNGMVSASATPKAMTTPAGVRWADREAWAWVDQLHVSPENGQLIDVLESPLLRSVGTLVLDEAFVRGEAAEAFRWSDGLATLYGLWLENCRTDDLMPLIRSPHAAGLRSLRVIGPALPEASFAALAQPGVLPRLEELDLPTSNVTPAEFAAALAAPRPLRSLVLRQDLRAADLRGLGQSDACAGLRRLTVMSSAARFPFEGLEGARFWPTLRQLQTVHVRMTDAAADALARVPSPLSVFMWHGDGLTRDRLTRLARSPVLSRLTHLDVRHQTLGPNVADALTALPAAPVVMDLRGCRIGDDGIRRLAAWPGLSRCRVLYLAVNGLTAAGAQALAESPHVTGLVGLNVASNDLGNGGVRHLVNAPWAENLEQLLVSQCRAGVGAVAELIRAAPRMPRMRELSIDRELVTDALREAFAHAAYFI